MPLIIAAPHKPDSRGMVSLAMMELVDICEESPALSLRFDSLARALVFRDLCPPGPDNTRW